MRLLIFNIVRAETDANNLAAACNCLALSEAAEDEESNPEQPQQLQQFKVQTEMNLRRTIYAKLAAVSALPAGLVSTTDLSREFGAHKRKHEKRLAKVAAEIIFGEESIEALLKPPKVETATAAGGATDQQPLPSEPSTPAPTPNPLMNLFDEPDDAAEQPPLPAPSPMEM